MGNNERRGGPSGLPRRSGVTILLDGCEKDGSLNWSRFCVGPAFVVLVENKAESPLPPLLLFCLGPGKGATIHCSSSASRRLNDDHGRGQQGSPCPSRSGGAEWGGPPRVFSDGGPFDFCVIGTCRRHD